MGSWLLLEDLNEITSSKEKCGEKSIWKKQLFLKKDGHALIKEQLDRAVANNN